MLSLDERLALLQADLLADPPAFIMARELPFAIFRYDPHAVEESEWRVRRRVQLLATQIQNQTQQPAVILSLADLFWRSIEESEEIESLYALEREHSFSVAERQVHQYLSDPDFRPLCDLLREEEKRLPKNTRVLFLVHATVFAPSAFHPGHDWELERVALRPPAIARRSFGTGTAGANSPDPCRRAFGVPPATLVRSSRRGLRSALGAFSSCLNLTDMKPLRARVIKFSVDGFWRVVVGRLDAPGAPVALVCDGQQMSNLGDSIARWSISEIHGYRSFRPTTASASRPSALSGSVNRYSREFESVQPVNTG